MLRSLVASTSRTIPAAALSRRAFSCSIARLSDGPSFQLNEDQLGIQDLARKFGRESVAVQAAELDRSTIYPWELMKEAHDLGLLNTHIPEEYGGPGLGLMECALISEEVAWGCTGVQTAMEANGLAIAPLLVSASHELKQKYLEPMTRPLKQGEKPIIASYCVTEPGAGSDVAGIKTKAEKVEGGWKLNGSKMWITNAGAASWFFVLAKTDMNVSPTKGMTGFVVETASEGVEIGKKEINMGQKCSDTRMVSFTDVFIPDENVIGTPGQGFKTAMGAFDITRPLVAAAAVGLAQRALEEATMYAQTRKTMGKPIIEHQAIAFILADMAIGVEAARSLVWKAAWQKDSGGRNTFNSSMAKAFASRVAVENASNACQVYGGAGFNNEYPVEKLYRDSKIFELYEGTTQIQKMIISRNLPALYPA